MGFRLIFRTFHVFVITMGRRRRIVPAAYGYAVRCAKAGSIRQIRWDITVRRKAVPFWGEGDEFKLPRKTSKENGREPYLKPTQVDEESIQRRSSEGSFRNSANSTRNFGRRVAPVGFIARGGRSESRTATV